MDVYTANLGPDTEYINSFIILSRRMISRPDRAQSSSAAFDYPHIQVGVAGDDQPLATVYVTRRLAAQASQDRITRASIHRPRQAPPSIAEPRDVEPRDGDDAGALVLLLIPPDEMIESCLPPAGVEVIAEASDGTGMARPDASRYGYLLLMKPGSEIIVRPRGAGPSGAIERRITLGAGGLDLIARDMESSAAVDVASIAGSVAA